mmetsp:Transcript_33803/g.80022  ORF Transcript_33803/g.80022 Transcript_33803/m.80022 type:complete len:298 (-) Transcript_33803:1840-2733(-)
MPPFTPHVARLIPEPILTVAYPNLRAVPVVETLPELVEVLQGGPRTLEVTVFDVGGRSVAIMAITVPVNRVLCPDREEGSLPSDRVVLLLRVLHGAIVVLGPRVHEPPRAHPPRVARPVPRRARRARTLDVALAPGPAARALARPVIAALPVPGARVLPAPAALDVTPDARPASVAHARAVRHAPSEGLCDGEVLTVDVECLPHPQHRRDRVGDGVEEVLGVSQQLHAPRDIERVNLQRGPDVLHLLLHNPDLVRDEERIAVFVLDLEVRPRLVDLLQTRLEDLRARPPVDAPWVDI